MDHRMHKAQWGAGNPRVRTSPSNWKLPLRWNSEQFVQCTDCGWRGSFKDYFVPNGNTLDDGTALGNAGCPSCHSTNRIPARRRVFCASLADVFDNEVDRMWLVDLLDVIRQCENLDFLLLTKRIGNVIPHLEQAFRDVNVYQKGEELFNWLRSCQYGSLPKNIWIGATVVNQEEADRDIPKLLQVPAAVRWLSMEPLLSMTDIKKWLHPRAYEHTVDHKRIDWVVVGGESGKDARPMHPDWVRALRGQCHAAGVPFMFKQWGAHGTSAYNATTNEPVFRMYPDYLTWVNKPTWAYGGICVDMTGKQLRIGRDFKEAAYPVAILHKIPKKNAGRVLDGRTWDDYPT